MEISISIGKLLSVLSQVGADVPAFKLVDNSVYVSKLVDGIEYPTPTLVNDSLINSFMRGDIQTDSVIVKYDTTGTNLSVEFVTICGYKSKPIEWQITIICNVEWIPEPTQIVPFDRFAICQGYYWYFTHYHSGMWSNEYKRLCKMQQYYKPAASERMPSSPESATIYNQLEERNGYKPTGWIVLSDDDNCSDILLWNDAD